MKYDEAKKIVDGIVENEFIHIQRFSENDFAKENLEYKENLVQTYSLYKKLENGMTEEQKDLLDELHSFMVFESVNLSKFYFKEGLRAGLCNLKFLNEIGFIDSIL